MRFACQTRYRCVRCTCALGSREWRTTSLAVPDDDRARKVAHARLAQLGAGRKLAVACHDVGISVRTLQRTFRRELGMDFDSWRRQARLLKAVELLAGGNSVKSVALQVGYRQLSTFTATSARHFGLTPKAWIAARTSKV